MKRIYFTLTTLDPVVLSESNATLNNQLSLDYIPGSAILGAVAGRNYQTFARQNLSWSVFHSGGCQFSACLPVIDGQLALPVPLSWHGRKDTQVSEGEEFVAAALSNHSSPDFSREDKTQYQQHRSHYVDANGKLVKVRKGQSTKTALDHGTGTVAEGQLYSYSHISAGQTFLGFIALTDDLAEQEEEQVDLMQQLRDALTGEFRIGRARNTEFGRVRVTPVELNWPEPASDGRDITLWCLSDIACLDEIGEATTAPDGSAVHALLSGYTLDLQRSFIRADALSRFNQKRGGWDSEQRVIKRGSVLVFTPGTTAKPLNNAQLTRIQQEGVGIDKHLGLGLIMLNPAWAKEATPTLNPAFTGPSFTVPEASGPSEYRTHSPLLRWLNVQHEQASLALGHEQNVLACVKRIATMYSEARRYKKIAPAHLAGPGQIQWRLIAALVNHDSDSWYAKTFGEKVDGQSSINDKDGTHICQPNNDAIGWGISWYSHNGYGNFAEACQRLIDEYLRDESDPIGFMRRLLEQLCRYELASLTGLRNAQRMLEERLPTTLKEQG
ncbi:hypothetical protein [Pseudoalteromonas rubra]|uniref:hypothetical protein n=1 Tax=Pseudoalteromonas rubra TaxID=43658 RepID=UPI000F78505F|nr:hypothetical protein [Pseudoalteromonas rubra]